jgi:signal peptidase I
MNKTFDLTFQILKKEGKFQVKFSGKSMRPTLKEGMQILIEKVNPQDVKLADIILYKNGDFLVTHRVIRSIQDGQKRVFVTKGDNDSYIDVTLISEEDLIGVVQAAFHENNSKTDVLIKNRLIGWLYLIMGNWVFWIGKKGKFIPLFIRQAFKPLVDGFFLVFKKFTHLIYLGLRYEQMFLKRFCSKSSRV